MTAFAVPKRGFDLQPTGKKSKAEKRPAYLDWIRTLPCLVTRRTPVEAAHVSFAEPQLGKLGRGKGAKESDLWAVPLSPEEHRRQHSMNERAYWAEVGINPVVTALALFAAYPDRDRALLIINSIPREITRIGELYPAGDPHDPE